jgi:hypothetical protein
MGDKERVGLSGARERLPDIITLPPCLRTVSIQRPGGANLHPSCPQTQQARQQRGAVLVGNAGDCD